jgi:hypothetical protein
VDVDLAPDLPSRYSAGRSYRIMTSRRSRRPAASRRLGTAGMAKRRKRT